MKLIKKILKRIIPSINKDKKTEKVLIVDNELDFIESGESLFLELIKDKIDVIFDVGTKDYSCFIKLNKEVHFFEPISFHLEKLKAKCNKTHRYFFNCFGLGNENCTKKYYIKSESFCNRDRFKSNKSVENIFIKKGCEYIDSKKIDEIDFLKIDVEGYEFEVIKGFEDRIQNVGIIQFEYGGTFKDMNIKLIEVIEYLKKYNFTKFSYLNKNGLELIEDFTDHYEYSNIVCLNKDSNHTNSF